jgi:hypothetical protein
VRRVARLDRDPQHVVVCRDQAVRGPFEQDAPPECRRRLAGGGRHESVDVKAREVQARRELLARGVVVVERLREDVHEAGKGVGCRAHDRDAAFRLVALA